MKYLFFLGLILLTSCTFLNKRHADQLHKPTDHFGEIQTEILVLGTFHFDYPGLDSRQVNESNKIDVLKEPKKSEVTEVVKYLKKFEPNKIAIEATNKWQATEYLRMYNQGYYREQRDERFQIGIRLASELALDTIYCVNSYSYYLDLLKLDSMHIDSLFKGFDFKSEDPYNVLYEQWWEKQEKLVSQVPLLDYFKYMNTKETHQYNYGAYLIGDFRLEETRGADILSIWWYNRNLRIFRNIQRITKSKKDRILVIVGNAHAAVLRQLFECSPAYKFIEFDLL